MAVCCICRRDREAFKTLVLTEEEKSVIASSTGLPPPEKTEYCKACWSVVTHRTQGPQLFRGMMHHHLRSIGVKDAGRLATLAQISMATKVKPKSS